MKKIENYIKELEKYPIYMNSMEIEFVASMVSDRRKEISELWKQLKSELWNQIKFDGEKKSESEKSSIFMNAFEIGFVMSIVADKRNEIPELWKQLIDMVKKFREIDSVKITELGGGLIKLTDIDGTSIIRDKYDWET